MDYYNECKGLELGNDLYENYVVKKSLKSNIKFYLKNVRKSYRNLICKTKDNDDVVIEISFIGVDKGNKFKTVLGKVVDSKKRLLVFNIQGYGLYKEVQSFYSRKGKLVNAFFVDNQTTIQVTGKFLTKKRNFFSIF